MVRSVSLTSSHTECIESIEVAGREENSASRTAGNDNSGLAHYWRSNKGKGAVIGRERVISGNDDVMTSLSSIEEASYYYKGSP